MIRVSLRHGLYRVRLHGCACAIGARPTLEGALIDAERDIRIDLDDVQALLRTERERLKTEACASAQGDGAGC